jgi:putative peptidoglycan lipid II flippase
MRKTIIVVSLLMILSKILGFIREISLAYFYGASFISDAYLVSISIPITLYTLFGVVIAQGLIPIFNKINLNEGSNEVNKFLSNILNVLTIINFLISIFGFINPYLLISIFAGGLTGNTLMLAVQFTRISIFGLIFTNLVYITSAFLRANKKFYIPAFVGIPLNIGIILSIFLSSIYGFHILPYGTLLSMIIEFLFIIPSLLKQNFRYSFVINLRSSYLINFVNLSIPLILSTIFFQISRSVDRYLASSLFNGAISSLNYSFRLISFIEGVLILPVLTVVFPKLSELYERKQLSNFNTLSNKTLSIILYLTIPIVTLTIINSESIVRMVYYRGAFNDSALIFTSLSLRIYALSIIPVALKEHYTRLFIAMNKSKTLYYVNFLSFSLMIILNLILFSEMGFIGDRKSVV